MNPQEREIIRQLLITIDAIELNVTKKINKITQFLDARSFIIYGSDMLESLNEIKSMLSDIPHRKKAVISLLDRQADQEKKLNKIKNSIKKHEGFRDHPYIDSVGIPTIGYGTNISKISKSEAEFLLNSRLDIVITDAIMLEEFGNLNEARQIVYFDMIYNLGLSRFKKFKKMRAAVKIQDWDKAAEEMVDSRWRRQVKGRALKLAKIMQTGELI